MRSGSFWDNLARMEQLVRRAAGEGATLIVPQELFADQYFCKDEIAAGLRVGRGVLGVS